MAAAKAKDRGGGNEKKDLAGEGGWTRGSWQAYIGAQLEAL
jgi:hypothetical protein